MTVMEIKICLMKVINMIDERSSWMGSYMDIFDARALGGNLYLH
jgi:hypothetical protein